MGLEMKNPENCENSLRNRKKKENVQDKSEINVKNSSSKSSEKMETIEPSNKLAQDEVLKAEKSDSKSQKLNGVKPDDKVDVKESNFKIRLEFDPMSIALFTLAIVTRFFRLSEPRNVV